MLPRRKDSAGNAVDEDFDARLAMRRASRIWLAAPSSPKAGGTGAWTAKAWSANASLELRERRRPFVASVRHGPQVGDGQVAFAVGSVRRGRDRGSVRRPHR